MLTAFEHLIIPLCLDSFLCIYTISVGWSGGAMVLGKLPVPGRPTN